MFYVELVKLAELHIEKGNLDKAKKNLLQALIYNPNYPWANLRMANLLLEENELSNAKKHLNTLINIDIENDLNLKNAVAVLQGDIACFQGEYKEAIVFYHTVLSCSDNIRILKSTLQKQLQILLSVQYINTEELVEKYLNLDSEIIISFITLFARICKKYKLREKLEFINSQYTYLSDELLNYRVNNLIISGSFSQAYKLIATIDNINDDKQYNFLVLHGEINEFLGNKLLSIKFLEKALALQDNINLKLKIILLSAEYQFEKAAEKLKILISSNVSNFTTENWQILLNNIKYKGGDLFEYVLKNYELVNEALENQEDIPIFCIEYRAILVIQKYLKQINNNKIDINKIFDFLSVGDLHSLLIKEILIQIYNGTYKNNNEHFSFIYNLNQYISKSDVYYRQLILNKLNTISSQELIKTIIIIINSTNIGDTILYLYSLFEIYNLSQSKIILITCFENQDIINLVKGKWIKEIIYLSRQAITSRYCPYQEIRPVLPGNITYLSQGGKDRLQNSTEDNVWQGNFLNFRRLNVVDYYLRKYHTNYSNNCSSDDIYVQFSQILKSNISHCHKTPNREKVVVIAPIANSLGYYYNLSEMNCFWVSIIERLLSASFTIKILKSNKEFCKETDDLIHTISNYCQNSDNVSELDIGIVDFVKYMENIDSFIGVRSGICDLISFLDNKHQKKICIYPPKINYCCGLSDWQYSNFIEYHLPDEYQNSLVEITDKIYALLQKKS